MRLAPHEPVEFIKPFCEKLRLSTKVEDIAKQLLAENIRMQQEENVITSGNQNPISIVAAAIYIASALANERRTREQISKVTGIHASTLRIHYRELAKKHVKLIESMWWDR